MDCATKVLAPSVDLAITFPSKVVGEPQGFVGDLGTISDAVGILARS